MPQAGLKDYDDLITITQPVKMSENLRDRLRARKVETGVPVATQIRRAIERELSGGKTSHGKVPLLGYIHAGASMVVTPLPPDTYSEPPFSLASQCYGLIVMGDSMTRAVGTSIPDGSYAYFCPDIMPQYGAVVHVEWPQNDGEHRCTLKRYCPNVNGTVAFEPFNKKNEPVVKKEGEFVIKGVFVRAWHGEEDEAVAA